MYQMFMCTCACFVHAYKIYDCAYFVLIHCMLPVAGERPARTKGTSRKEDSSKEEKNEDAIKEKQSNKKGQEQQDNIQGTNFIKRNIEVSKLQSIITETLA